MFFERLTFYRGGVLECGLRGPYIHSWCAVTTHEYRKDLKTDIRQTRHAVRLEYAGMAPASSFTDAVRLEYAGMAPASSFTDAHFFSTCLQMSCRCRACLVESDAILNRHG